MTSIYFVTRWDTYNDEHSEHLVALYLDKQQALDYAGICPLEHEERVTVEEKCLGLQKEWTGYIYERQYYDDTQVLFDIVGYRYFIGGHVGELTQDDIINISVQYASPLITENIDFNKLYQLYLRESDDDES